MSNVHGSGYYEHSSLERRYLLEDWATAEMRLRFFFDFADTYEHWNALS